MDGRLGIALGYARLDSPGQAERFEAWGYPTDIAPAQGAFTLGGGKLQASSTDNVREGYMGVLEFNASENYSMLLDVYYSEFEKAEAVLGTQRHNAMFYPAMSVHPVFMQLRVIQPLAVDLTRIDIWTLRMKGAPAWMHRRNVAFANTVHSPSSIVKADDLEIYARVQRGVAAEGELVPHAAEGFDDRVDLRRGVRRRHAAADQAAAVRRGRRQDQVGVHPAFEQALPAGERPLAQFRKGKFGQVVELH